MKNVDNLKFSADPPHIYIMFKYLSITSRNNMSSEISCINDMGLHIQPGVYYVYITMLAMYDLNKGTQKFRICKT